MALVCLKQALHQVDITGEHSEVAGILLNIGIAYRKKGDLKSAEKYVKQAEEIFQRDANTLGICETWGNLGDIYCEQARWSDAQAYLLASLKGYRNLGNHDGEIKILNYFVEFYLVQTQWSQAKHQLEELEHVITGHRWFKNDAYLLKRLANFRVQLQAGRMQCNAPADAPAHYTA